LIAQRCYNLPVMAGRRSIKIFKGGVITQANAE